MTKEEEAIENLTGLLESNYVDSFEDAENEALKMAIEAIKQKSCEDEYIKVPKKALKYRTAGMVAYNVEWLKNHFDIERAVICGAKMESKK